jgi:ribosomal protein S12 methylthiotransferase
LHYVYPYPHVDDILPLMAEFCEHGYGVLPYLDIPLQHAHPDVLKRMKRPASGEKNLERIQAWRAACPDLVIRSTFIAGFPGETEAEFQYLLDFLEEAQIDRAGCFAYSPVEGATANLLENPVAETIREERRARFMARAEAISIQRLTKKVGKRIQVLIDRVDDSGGIGRTTGDAPEIDGLVRVLPASKPSKRYRTGEIIKATVISAQGHDLIAET